MEGERTAGSNWVPCFADPERGVAFFDGITIYTDQILDPRADRVAPIYPEDQIFFARTVREIASIRPNLKVLDVRTGSGIQAITCAKLNCAVHATDTTHRSTLFVRENAGRNEVRLSKTLEPGAITVDVVDQDASFKSLAQYDLILLSPPYNPTFMGGSEPSDQVLGVNVASHASAGEYGQEACRNQIAFYSQYLADGGRMLVRHMVLDDKESDSNEDDCPDILRNFQKKNPQYQVAWKNVSEASAPCKSFLKFQYEHLLDSNESDFAESSSEQSSVDKIRKAQRDELRVWINKLPDSASFRFVHMEIVKNDEPVLNSISDDSRLPPWDWRSRILFHQQVTEHVAIPDTFPTPALFLERDGLPPLDSIAKKTGENSALTAIFRYIDTWIRQSGLVSESGPFDFIWMDAAPWYPTQKGLASLVHEFAFWLGPSKCLRLKDGKQLLQATERYITTLQDDFGDTFLHPGFTGGLTSRTWRSVLSTIKVIESSNQSYQNHDSEIDSIRYEIDRSSMNDNGISNQMMKRYANVIYGKIATTVVNNEDQAWAILDSLDSDDLSILRANIPNHDRLVMDHLVQCHDQMHEGMDNLFKQEIGRFAGESAFVAVPITLSSPMTKTTAATDETLYRGCVWLYASFRKGWTLTAERELLDLARLATLMFGGAVQNTAAAELAERQVQGIAQHEMKDLVWALASWSTDPSELGISDLPPEYGITLFPHLFRAGISNFTTWSMSSRPEDLPFYESGPLPNTIDGLIRLCWDSAVTSLLFQAVVSYTKSAANIEKFKLFEERLRGLLNGERIKVTGNYEITWHEDSQEALTNLSRLFLHISKECIQHGDWQKPIEVTITENKSKGPSIIIESLINDGGILKNKEYLNTIGSEIGIGLIRTIWKGAKRSDRGKQVFPYLINELEATGTSREDKGWYIYNIAISGNRF